MLRLITQPLVSACTPHLRKIKRSFQKQRAEKPNLSVYFTSTQSCCSPFAFSPHVPATPNSQFNLVGSLGDHCVSSLVHPRRQVRVSTHAHGLPHTLEEGKPKQGENVLPCPIPAVSKPSRGGGCTMHSLYLRRASSPTEVNPSVAACRAWGGRVQEQWYC